MGSLDLDCTDTISLDHLKRLVCVPIYLVKKDDIRGRFDEAWTELTAMNHAVSIMMRDKVDPLKGPGALPISFRLFELLLTKTSFAKLLEVAKPFGSKG